MTRSYTKVAETAAGIAQALEASQMLRKGLQGVRVQLVEAYPCIVSPLGEAVDTTQQMRNPTGLVASRLQPLAS